MVLLFNLFSIFSLLSFFLIFSRLLLESSETFIDVSKFCVLLTAVFEQTLEVSKLDFSFKESKICSFFGFSMTGINSVTSMLSSFPKIALSLFCDDGLEIVLSLIFAKLPSLKKDSLLLDSNSVMSIFIVAFGQAFNDFESNVSFNDETSFSHSGFPIAGTSSVISILSSFSKIFLLLLFECFRIAGIASVISI